MHRGQVSSEFLILIGVIFILLLLFLSYAADNISDLAYRKEMNAIRDVGLALQHEFFIATEVKDGYMRHFEVPIKNDGVGYNISIVRQTLILVSENSHIEQPFLIPKVSGNITKGQNTISRRGGVIYLNS
jgi:hypothetical protein